MKTEIESWDLFDAAEEVAFGDMQKGAMIIPLVMLAAGITVSCVVVARSRAGPYKGPKS